MLPCLIILNNEFLPSVFDCFMELVPYFHSTPFLLRVYGSLWATFSLAASETHHNFLTFWPRPLLPERCLLLNKCSQIHSSTSTAVFTDFVSYKGYFFCPKWTLLWKILWHNLHLLPFFTITLSFKLRKFEVDTVLYTTCKK